MSGSLEKPNVIILGGLNTCSRALATFLVPLEGEPLVSHLRIVDKFSVAPPTTYLGPEFSKVLEKPNVEYRQANLTIEGTVKSVFNPPEGQAPYSYVLDLTGEVRHDRPHEVQISHTFYIARLCALEAARRQVKAYVRLQHPYYQCQEKGTHDEKQDAKPFGHHGIWWHETLRMLATVNDLNLVVLRIGLIYGPYITYGYLTTILCATAVYGYMKKPMKALHSPGTFPIHTVHIDDVVAGLWACAEWMSQLGRKEADVLAGEEFPFHNDKTMVKEVEGMIAPDVKVVAPLFNLVDDGDSRFIGTLRTMTGFFGTTVEFYNFFAETFAKFKMEDVVEDVNEEHVSGWTEMLQASKPTIENTPLTPYVDQATLDKHVVAFDNGKIKNVIGIKLKRPEFCQDTIKEVVDKWKEERAWPVTY